MRTLVAGPNVWICDECIDLCIDIVGPEILSNARPKHSAAVSLEELGVKPRFNKLRFTQRANHIFFLCPFCEPFNQIYSDHVRAVAKREGFSIDRADEIYGTQPIIEDIWESINSAEIIVADVTGRNPNVMYEIGMAHTVGKPVIIITQSMDDVPFDLKHHRCIVYAFTPRGCAELEEKLRATLAFVRGVR